MTEKSKFNLLDESWVYVTFCDGKRQVLSLRDCFARACEIRRLSFGQDAVSFAVLRIIVAIMQRTLYVASAANGGWNAPAWQHAYQNPKETLGLVNQYLETWRDRFFLIDPDHPFFQHPTLRKRDDSCFGVGKFLLDVPDNKLHFTMRIGRGTVNLSYPEAAAQLIHLQAYSPSGNLPAAVGDERAKDGKVPPIGTGWVGAQGGVYIEGETLFSTLMLNTLAIGQSGEESEEAQATGIIATNPKLDLPVWEREEQPVGQREDIYPQGLADMLTWQSRRVKLIDGGDSVIGVVLCQGDIVGRKFSKLSKTKSALLNGYTRESMGVWRFSEEETKKLLGQITYMPRKHDPSRALWRGLTSLLPEFPGKIATYKEVQVQASLPPAVVRWVGWLLSNGYLPESATYRLRSCGYVYSSLKNPTSFDEAISDYLAVPPRLLTGNDQESLYLVKTAMELMDELASAVASLAENLQRALGAETSQAARIARERFYSEIDEQFRGWLLGVGTAKGGLDTLWKSGYGIAEKLESELLAAAPDAAMKGRIKNGTVYDLPTCVKWFADKLSRTESKVSAFNESKENHE